MNVMKEDKFEEGYYYKFIGDIRVKENAKRYWYVSPMNHILEGNWHKCTFVSNNMNNTSVKFDSMSDSYTYIHEEYVPCDSFVECSPEEYENIKDINWEVGATYFDREDEHHSVTIKHINYDSQKVWTTNDLWIDYLSYKNWSKEVSTKSKSFVVKVISKRVPSWWYEIGEIHEVIDSDPSNTVGDYRCINTKNGHFSYISKLDCVIYDKEKEKEFDKPFKHDDSVIVIKNKNHWKQDYVGDLWNVGESANLDTYTSEHFRLATEQEKIKHSLGLKPTASYRNRFTHFPIIKFDVSGDIVQCTYREPSESLQWVNYSKENLLDHIEEDIQLEIHATSFTGVTVTLPTPLNKGEKITICYTGYGSDENEYKSFSHKYFNKVDKNSDSSDIEYQSFSSKYISLIKEK